MQENQVMKAIYERRSIRKYEERAVSRDVIEELLSAAVMSPSAMNKQPWEFVVVTDRNMIKELSDRVKKKLGTIGHLQRFAEKVTSREDLIFYGAPLLIIVTSPKNSNWSGINMSLIDCAILSQTMSLAGHSLGLGSCFIGFAFTLNDDQDALRMLGIPEDRMIAAPLIFGYPSEKKDPPDRNPKVSKWI